MFDGTISEQLREHLATADVTGGVGRVDEEFEILGAQAVAGVDEAGRGPLAGPLVAAAVVIPESVNPFIQLPGLNDSKALSESRREKLFPLIQELCHYAIVSRPAAEIDRIGINPANHGAMLAAVGQISGVVPDVALIDGYKLPEAHHGATAVPTVQVVKGDQRALCIAAASVLAKVTRDRYMAKVDLKWPQYGFASHKGYGSKAHLAALREFGPCPEHRRTFKPVATLLEDAPG